MQKLKIMANEDLYNMDLHELVETYNANSILIEYYGHHTQMHQYDIDEKGKEYFQESYDKFVRSNSFKEKIINEIENRLFD